MMKNELNHAAAALNRLLLVLACIAISNARLHAADPNKEAPYLPIASVGVATDSKELWQKLVAADASIRKSFERLSQDRAPNAKDVSKLYVEVEQFRRWQQSLEHCFEPAAIDFKFREVQYGQFLANTLTRFWGSPQSGPIQQRAYTQLQKSFAKRTKQIQSFGSLLPDDPRAAEVKLDSYYDDVFSTGGLLNPTKKAVVYDNLSATEGRIRSAMHKVRKQQASQDIGKEIELLRAKYEILINEVQGLQISAGSGQWKGNPLSGPELFRAIVADWKAAHLAAVRYSALQQMLYSKGPMSLDDEPGATAGTAGEAAKLTTRVLSGLAKLINADAEFLQGPAAIDRYHLYLEQVADLRMRLSNPSDVAIFEEPLANLSQKAGYSNVVKNYREATSDVLRWRQKFAAASSQHLSTQHPAIERLAKQKLTSTATPMLFPVKNGSLPTLLKPVPAVVHDVDQALNGQDCSISRLRSLDNRAMWMSSLTGGFYARVRIAPAVLQGAEARLLHSDLMLSGDAKPLTILAAAAHLSALRGEYETVGGKATNFAIESSLSRYCALPSIASNLVPIGFEIPRLAVGHPRGALAVRCDLTPSWVQHEYFVVQPEK